MSVLLFLEILTFVANLISSQYYSVSKYSQFLKPREEILVAALLSSRAEISKRHLHIYICSYLHEVASVVFLTYLNILTTTKPAHSQTNWWQRPSLLLFYSVTLIDMKAPPFADFGHNDFEHCKVCVLANWRQLLYSLVYWIACSENNINFSRAFGTLYQTIFCHIWAYRQNGGDCLCSGKLKTAPSAYCDLSALDACTLCVRDAATFIIA